MKSALRHSSMFWISLPLILASLSGCERAGSSTVEQAPAAAPSGPAASSSGPAQPAVAAPAGKVIELNDGNFAAEVLQSKEPVLVDFWAAWCRPCLMLAPTIDDLAREYGGRVKVGKLNVDQARKTAGQFGIQALPTAFIFKDGKVVETLVGLNPKSNYQRLLNKHVGSAPAAKS